MRTFRDFQSVRVDGYRLRRWHRRRGSLYIAVLTTCMVTSVLAVSAFKLTAHRRVASIRSAECWSNRWLAESGLAAARAKLDAAPNWRGQAINGVWAFSVDFPDGRCEVTVLDPADQNVADDAADPYEIRVIGRGHEGSSTVSASFVDQPESFDVLDYGIYAGGSIALSGFQALRGTPIGCNGAMSVSSSNLYCDLRAGGAMSGGAFHADVQQNQGALTLPNITNLYESLVQRSTVIPLASLGNAGDGNYFPDPEFASSVLHWSNVNESGHTCMLELVKNPASTPPDYLSVSGRSASGAGPVFDLTDYLTPSETYQISFRVNSPSASQSLRIVTYLKTVGSSGTLQASAPFTVNSTWRTISATPNINWSGTLERALVRIESSSGTTPFLVDQAECRLQRTYRMTRVVLSDVTNSYGLPNPEGIYSIDCGGSPIVLDQIRLRGTLLLRNAGTGSKICRGPSCMEPSVSGLPTLMVCNSTGSNSFGIDLRTAGMVESVFGRSLNPPGMPAADGTTDLDLLDRHPAGLRGSFLIQGNLLLRTDTHLEGTLLATGSVNASGRIETLPEPRGSARLANWKWQRFDTELVRGLHVIE